MATALTTRQERYNEVRKVTLIGSLIDFLLGVAKILFGLIASSQALVADGIHSLSDLATDFIVLYAAKHSHKEADEDHPYGHGRIETLATVGLGLALIIVSAGIAYEALLRLNEPGMLLHPGVMALLVALVSVVSKEWIYRYTVNAARKLRSDMLMANAWHSRSDAISSIVVVIGIAGTMYGYPYLDAVAAVVVAVMIAKIGFDLVRSSTRELIDTALEPEEIEMIRKQIFSVSGVRAVHMLRTRKSAGCAFVDVHIQVDPDISVSEGHQIGEMVRRRLLDKVDVVSDVTVHIDPEDDEVIPARDDLPSREQVIAALKQRWPELPENAFESLTLHYLKGELAVELVLPIDLLPAESDARAFVEQLRAKAESLSYISDIQIHFRA